MAPYRHTHSKKRPQECKIVSCAGPAPAAIKDIITHFVLFVHNNFSTPCDSRCPHSHHSFKFQFIEVFKNTSINRRDTPPGCPLMNPRFKFQFIGLIANQ